MKTTAIIIISLLMFGVILGGCAKAPTQEVVAKEKLKVGLVVWPGFIPYYVAQEKGYLSNEDVEFIIMDVTGVKSAFEKGDVDALSLTPEIIEILNEGNTEFGVVMTTDYSYGGDGIIVMDDITEIQDLEGKEIAYETGSPSHWFLLYVLDQGGLGQQDIETVDMPVPDAGAAFAAGQIDVAVTWEPWLSAASEREGGKLLVSTADYETPVLPAVLVVRKDVLESRESEVKGLMKGWFEGLKYTQANEDEAYQIGAEVFEIPADEVAAIVTGLRWMDYDTNLDYWGISDGTDEFSALIDETGDIWVSAGLASQKADPNKVLDKALLTDLYK